MITDENNPRMRAAEAQLVSMLSLYAGVPLSTSVFHNINTMLLDHRTRWRQEGVQFPVLAALVVPRLHILDLVNAELEGDALRLRIVGFVRRHRGKGMTTAEAAQAVKWAFPSYKGGGFGD